MSFLGGPECSTGANPLSQFSKHVQDDNSLQRDRLVGRGPGGMQETMRSQPMGPGQEGVRETTSHIPLGTTLLIYLSI
jgi:peroxin-5